MTDQTTPDTPETPDEAPLDTSEDTTIEPAPTDDTSVKTDDEDDGKGKAAREAAKYRTRLRETEAERDTLRATVERLQRAEVERLVGERLSQPGDVWEIGKASLDNLVDEEGNVVPELVDTTVYGLLQERPGLAKPAPRQKYPSGIGLGHRGPGPSGPSWGDVLTGH